MKKIFETRELFILLLLGFFVRVFAAYFYGEGALINEWGTLVHNFEKTGIIGIFIQLDEFTAIDKLAETGEKVLPSAFMPPLYFYFIYIIKFIFEDFLNFIHVIIFIQIILSLTSIYLFHRILNFLENNKNINLIILTIFALFPLYIYSSVQISSISLQIFLFLGFFYFLIEFNRTSKKKFLFFFSIVAGLLILTRGEFYLFYLLTLVYFFLFIKKKLQELLISLIISLIIISPYLYRNYLNFNTITITKSVGFNLLKGNNPTYRVEGNSDFIINNFSSTNIKLKTKNDYEISLDNFYKEKALDYIKNDPTNYINFYFKKVFSYIFLDFNSSYDNYYNPFHLIPKILISFIGFVSAIICLRKKGFFQYLSLYYFANIFLFSVFFILPRYSVILLPINLLLTLELVNFLRRKFIN